MGAAIRVLYVDDESTLLEISKLFLEAGGEFVVDTLQSAQDALLLLETERYDAIISDYQMPEMDGIEFLKTLRAAGNTIPFILFTGRGREEIVIQALNHGADFYLQKGGEPRSLYAELAHKIHQSVNRKRSEEALKESEMRFRQVFETLPIGLWLADKNGNLIMGNPAGQKIWGAEPHFGQEEYGAFKAWRMPSREQIRPDDWALAHAVNEGRVTEHELLEIEAFNGIHKHILNWVSPVKNENDEIFGAFVINQDITESEHAIKALHESECRFRAIFNATFEFMALLEPDGNIVVVNETALQFGGFSLADVIHKPFWEILWWTISPEISARLKDAVSRVASGEFVRYEVDVLGKDNRVVTIDFSLKPVRDGSGTITSLVAEGRDISGIKRTEQLLRQQTDAMESAIDGMAILDKNQQYSYMNPAHARFYGYDSPEELIGKSWRLLYDEEELIRFEREIMPEFIRKGNFRGATRGKKKDGSTYPQEISLTALEDGGLICIVRDITEQKNIEDALRESEERFRTLAAYIQDPVLILDFDGSVQYANNAAFRFVGIPPSLDVSSENIAPFIAPESQEKALADLEMIKVSGGPSIAEYRMRTAQGEMKWVEAVGIRVSWNKTDRDLVALRDITSRKQAEEELRLKDNAIESSINAIAIGDLSGNLTYVNPAFLSIWGYEDRNEVLGRSAISFWIVEDEAQQVFEEIHATGKWSGQMTGRKKDGTSIQVQLSGNLIRGASGEPVAMMSSFIDITDQKRIEKALRQSEQKFRSMVEASPDIIWETDTRGNFTYVSPQSSQQLGYPPEELIGSPLLKLVSPESLDAMHKIFLSIIQDKSSFITFEIPAVHRNGSVVVLEIRSVIINDEDGQVIGLRGIARDITERRKAEESLQLANRKLHLLSSITRHDINNQLSIMRGYCKLLETKMHDPAFSGYFEKVNASSERISSIIRFTREYEDLGVKTSAWQDIWQLLEPATRDLGLGHIRLINDLPPGMEVLADPLIVRVFFNLVDNAVRYGGKITTIRFSVKESGEDQVIVCENDGESIPYDEKEKIFERGFGKNTGFGLFLIREILAITHITIKETGEPGKGARFEMMVPRGNYRFGDITDVRDSIKDE